MVTNREFRAKRIDEAKKMSASKFGGMWYHRDTYIVTEPKHNIKGWVRMLDVVEGICIADYHWKKGTGSVNSHEPNTSYWGDKIGAGTGKVLKLKFAATVYVHIRESHIMLEKPQAGRDYTE